MTVRFEKRRGVEVAILPRKDYEELIEDLGTARLVARAKREIAAGAPLFPIEVADRLANDESAVKVLREWRGLTQIALADASGVAQGYLSDIERGNRKGTAAVLKKIAKALGVPLDLLV